MTITIEFKAERFIEALNSLDLDNVHTVGISAPVGRVNVNWKKNEYIPPIPQSTFIKKLNLEAFSFSDGFDSNTFPPSKFFKFDDLLNDERFDISDYAKQKFEELVELGEEGISIIYSEEGVTHVLLKEEEEEYLQAHRRIVVDALNAENPDETQLELVEKYIRSDPENSSLLDARFTLKEQFHPENGQFSANEINELSRVFPNLNFLIAGGNKTDGIVPDGLNDNALICSTARNTINGEIPLTQNASLYVNPKYMTIGSSSEATSIANALMVSLIAFLQRADENTFSYHLDSIDDEIMRALFGTPKQTLLANHNLILEKKSRLNRMAAHLLKNGFGGDYIIQPQ